LKRTGSLSLSLSLSSFFYSFSSSYYYYYSAYCLLTAALDPIQDPTGKEMLCTFFSLRSALCPWGTYMDCTNLPSNTEVPDDIKAVKVVSMN
jgi:hypothetical protein